MTETQLENVRHSPVDCVVVGGGPAGLTAAIYLARFHLSVLVIDSAQSRASQIPLSRNHAGFPDGISGPDLLDRIRQQAVRYGARLLTDAVTQIEIDGTGFLVHCGPQEMQARTVLMTTGVVNNRPEMMDTLCHDQALASGRLRYCPICDGFEVTDQRVAVLGTGEHGCREAQFLRSYTADVTLVAPRGGHDLTRDQTAELSAAGIAILGECRSIALVDNAIVVRISDAATEFDSLYPALGSQSQSALAERIGARRSKEGSLIVDSHQRTSIPGLYAAGDVVLGLDQISHAMGGGGVAATTIRNDLAEVAPLRR